MELTPCLLKQTLGTGCQHMATAIGMSWVDKSIMKKEQQDMFDKSSEGTAASHRVYLNPTPEESLASSSGPATSADPVEDRPEPQLVEKPNPSESNVDWIRRQWMTRSKDDGTIDQCLELFDSDTNR